MLGPPVGGMPLEIGSGGWDDDGDGDNTNLAVWRERERRQRTVRVLMMFLLMLLLMDGEEGNPHNSNNGSRNRNGGGPGGLRKRNQKKSSSRASNVNKPLAREIWDARQKQDEMVRNIAVNHPRYAKLVEKNGDKDYDVEVMKYSEHQAEQEKDEFVESVAGGGVRTQPSSAASLPAGAAIRQMQRDPEEDRKVFHYPWNSTGFYRGSWVRAAGGGSGGSGGATETATTTSSTASTETAATTRRSEALSMMPATPAAGINSSSTRQKLDAVSLEADMLDTLASRKEKIGVFVLPPHKEILMRDDNNLTTLNWESMTVDAAGRTYRPLLQEYNRNHRHQLQQMENKAGGSGSTSAREILMSSASMMEQKVTLAHDSGRAAFQIFSRSIPSVSEISLVDGFVKLYDSTSPGYSTRKDILLRVRGVHVHSIGRISLVSANVDVARSAFVMEGKPTAAAAASSAAATIAFATTGTNSETEKNDENEAGGEETGSNDNSEDQRRRRLMENLEKVAKEEEGEDSSSSTATMDQIRDDAFSLFSRGGFYDGGDGTAAGRPPTSLKSSFHSPDWREYTASADGSDDEEDDPEGWIGASNDPPFDNTDAASTTTRRMAEESGGSTSSAASAAGSGGSSEDKSVLPPWSSIVMPFPFTRDDDTESIRRERTPGARRMPPREQLLEANAGDCEFEINMDVEEVEWTIGAWRNLLTRRFREAKRLDPSSVQHDQRAATDTDSDASSRGSLTASRPNIRGSRAKKAKALQDQALVVTIVGTIHSENCNFHAALNATALRTDWEATTAKAINYSFYMMLVCLTQILVLLRQLLHSQSQSTATRVSLLCVGWQTVIDALLCLVHIYLSLAMQPLFTAFASVAFFKLLIFCIIEMKYMAMIIQARNSSNGGQATEVLRRQIAMLHLRFYVALFGTFLLVFYIGEKYRVIYALALYSFWVPQIVFNIYTEARTPLHTYYIYGMSISRLVTPLYMFGLRNNFLKEVYPDFTSDTFTCQVLVLWVAIQAAILIAQGKYGARFMIPARFLPPKFDYSRPLPQSMYENHLDSAATSSSATDKSPRKNETSPDAEPLGPSSNGEGLHRTHSSSSSPSRTTDRHTTAVTTRNRGRGGSTRNRPEHHQSAAAMTKVGVVNVGLQDSSNLPAALPVPPQHSIDCSICYDSIDTRNRSGYMLAPCDHIFHRDCLIQWMDVKMECPICRMELPAL